MRRFSFRFCLAVAALALAGRLIAFDGPVFFRLMAVPNHDMYQGAPFFATSMHSVAMSGDIAWWNPIAANGYAQYYQSFLAPLAPTPHSLAFIVWAQAVAILSRVGVRIPEYYQYLLITYVVLPLLAFLAVAALASMIFRRRAAVTLMLIVYVYSGIGLWNSAWFYFQEAASLFFLLAATIAVCRKPSWPRLAVLLLAVVNQATSVNYWTVYNIFFIVAFLGSYALIYQRPVRRLVNRAVRRAAAGRVRGEVPTTRRLAALGVLLAATGLLWTLLIGSIAVEQTGAYARTESGGYSAGQAYLAVNPLRYLILEPFDPEIARALEQYPIDNPMHNARYIGAVLAPFLVLLPCWHWQRRERWLISAALGVLAVCLAPPVLLAAWKIVPFMDRVQHVFNFYSHYWQFMLALLATAVFDGVIGGMPRAAAGRALKIAAGVAVAASAVLALAWAFSGRFSTFDPNFQAVVRASFIALVPCVLMVQRFLFDTRDARRMLIGGVLLLAFADLTRYFYVVNGVDMKFTGTRWVEFPLADDIKAKLRRSWAVPDLASGFASNVKDNMPVPNVFWPVNSYMPHRLLRTLPAPSLTAIRDVAMNGPSLEFFTRAEIAPLPTPSDPGGAGSVPSSSRALWLSGPQTDSRTSDTGNAREVAGSGRGATGFRATWLEWGYNGFAFDVEAPDAGFMLVRQIPDPLWRIEVDGRRVHWVPADLVALAVPIEAGRHDVRMTYWPLARRLYWPASLALEATWVALLATALKRPARRLEAA